MSEQEKPKSSYMQELDQWIKQEVILPLDYAGIGDEPENAEEVVRAKVSKAIRTKVLESYRNGQAARPAKPRAVRKEPRR